MSGSDSNKEYGVLEPVAKQDRHFGFLDMMLTWMGANFQPGAWAVGGAIASAGFLGAMSIVLIANPATYIILALVALISYKIGLPTIILTRPALGVKGGTLAVATNIISIIGWTAISNFFAAITISFIFNAMFGTPAYGSPGSEIWLMLGCCINAFIAFIAVFIGGSRSLKIFERIMMITLIILAIFISIKLFHMVTFKELIEWVIPADKRITFGVGMDAMIAYGITWANICGDYTRYTRNATSATLAPVLGASIAAIWFAVIGVISVATIALTTGFFDANNANPSSLIMGLGFSWIALIVVVFSTVTTTMVNLYSGSINLLSLHRRISQRGANWVIVIVTTLLAFVPVFYGSFVDLFMAFMDILSVVFPPMLAIVIVDFFLIKKQNYEVAEMDKKGGRYWYTNGFNVTAIIVWVAGAIIYMFLRSIKFGAHSVGAVLPCFLACCLLYYIVARATNKSSSQYPEKSADESGLDQIA